MFKKFHRRVHKGYEDFLRKELYVDSLDVPVVNPAVADPSIAGVHAVAGFLPSYWRSCRC